MSNNLNIRGLYMVIAVLVGAILVVAVYIVISSLLAGQPLTQANTAASTDGITRIDPPIEVPPFTLTAADGTFFNSAQLLGRPVLLSFGFTHCPDICPLTLRDFRRVHAALGDHIHLLWISVDGERDTPAVMTRRFQQLEVEDIVIGLTGQPAAVRTMGQPLGLDFIYSEPNESGFYNVDHTASYFLLDAQGRWIRRFAFGTDLPTLLAELEIILQQTPQG
jgi:protein SCO1/2